MHANYCNSPDEMASLLDGIQSCILVHGSSDQMMHQLTNNTKQGEKQKRKKKSITRKYMKQENK